MATYQTRLQTVERLTDDGFGPVAELGVSFASAFGRNEGSIRSLFDYVYNLPLGSFAAAGFRKDNGQAITDTDRARPTRNLSQVAALTDDLARFGFYIQWLLGQLYLAQTSGTPIQVRIDSTGGSKLFNQFVNPLNRHRNMIAAFGPYLEMVMEGASRAIDAHLFVGEKVSDAQTLAWPRNVGGSTTPKPIINAYAAEVFLRLTSIVRLGFGDDLSFAKEMGISDNAFSALVAQASSRSQADEVSQALRLYGSRSISIDYSTARSDSLRQSSSERRSFVDRVSTEPEVDFLASPMLSLKAWGQLRPYFDLDRQRKLERIIREGGS